ncbi:hypothetical protein HMPREF0973_01376 [Prevotella veroralis F0319]|uniref:Uncharacterized protein n=1 Tax=Prevotella veroralis F0319 TaxID=649761 RepID=C9MP38_9BACT|nr:hypothetical protein HMPREF0973_01376 [Prevotella veroralis F0319]
MRVSYCSGFDVVILALILVYSIAILTDIIMYFSSITELFEIDYTFISTAPNIPNLFLK